MPVVDVYRRRGQTSRLKVQTSQYLRCRLFTSPSNEVYGSLMGLHHVIVAAVLSLTRLAATAPTESAAHAAHAVRDFMPCLAQQMDQFTFSGGRDPKSRNKGLSTRR